MSTRRPHTDPQGHHADTTMHRVPAPPGYEGRVHWMGVLKSWAVSYRRVGDPWWNIILLLGHRHSRPSEILDRATMEVAEYVANLLAAQHRA